MMQFAKTRVKFKGKALREMQEKIILVEYALEKALQDCFLREEVFDLLDNAKDCAGELERMLGV